MTDDLILYAFGKLRHLVVPFKKATCAFDKLRHRSHQMIESAEVPELAEGINFMGKDVGIKFLIMKTMQKSYIVDAPGINMSLTLTELKYKSLKESNIKEYLLCEPL